MTAAGGMVEKVKCVEGEWVNRDMGQPNAYCGLGITE